MPRQRATAVSWPTKPMPAQRAELPLEGRYTRAEVAQISLGFIPQGPQDKWFIYLVDHLLLGRFAPFPTPRSLAKSDRSRYRRHLMGREDAGGGSITLRMAGNGRE